MTWIVTLPWLRSLPATLIVAHVLGCVGCNAGAGLAPVKGTVTLDGLPLRKGTIIFEPAGRSATGKIANGAIVDVTTYQPGDGVQIGTHRIAFFATEDADPAVMSPKSIIPEKYNHPDTSGATAEIKAGQNVVEFKLVSK